MTNENKREYLNALAQYRLAAKSKVQADAFLKGLNEVVPDELLSIFDENELEVRSSFPCKKYSYNTLSLLVLVATYVWDL